MPFRKMTVDELRRGGLTGADVRQRAGLPLEDRRGSGAGHPA